VPHQFMKQARESRLPAGIFTERGEGDRQHVAGRPR
jgi:hypothetical protein